MKKLFSIFIITLSLSFQFSTFNSFAQTTVCQGDTVILIVDNPAGTIQWQQSSDQITWNNITSATNDSLQVQALTELFYRALIHDATCNLPIDYYSDTLNFNILGYLPVSVSISATPSTTICSGSNVTFTAIPVNGGSNPQYQWMKNGSNIIGATSSTYSTTSLSNNDNISCNLTSSYQCPTGNPASSNTIAMTVNPFSTITLTSAAGSNAQTKCISTAITNITYSTTSSAGATVMGLPSGVTGNWASDVVTISGTPTAAGTFNYTVTLLGTCPTTTTGSITVNPSNNITLSSTAGTNAQTKCISTSITNITYSTTGATGATVTGLPTGVTGNWASDVVTISGTPTAAGTFNYTVTLTGGCGTVTATGAITVTSNNTITLTSAAGTNAQTKCISTAITSITYSTTGATGATFTGLPTGVTGNWSSNVVTISGTPTTSGTFNYTVTLTGGCGNIAATGSLTINPNLPVSVSISANPGTTICSGTSVTFTATPTNGGSSPAYQWKKNGSNISGATSSTYSTTTLVNSDVITCVLTSNASCATGSPANSNAITFIIGTHYIGESYGGGIIFYVDNTCQYGLIAAPSDQSTGAAWGCEGTAIGGTSTAIGSGQSNTTTIVNGCSTAGIAARLCNDLVLSGYSDWYLPSKDELNNLYLNKNIIGGFGPNYYWSSSEYDLNYAWEQDFPSGTQIYDGQKQNSYSVRAIRSFPAIGDFFHGGIIAYILQPGDPGYDANIQHGLIAAPSDQSTGAEWGCYGTALSGADGTAIGTGSQNTIDIIAGCAIAGIAARLCNDLVLGGYSDWYLPSQNELNKLYLNRITIGGFTNIGYWSSTETDNNLAKAQNFSTGNIGNNTKSSIYYVRAVRSF